MYPTLFFTTFVLASCLTRPASEAQQPGQSAPSRVASSAVDAFPAPKEGLSIKVAPDADPKLDTLLSDFSRVTGQVLLINKDVKAMLQNTSTGLNRSVDVPASEVYSFVEFILAQNGILLIPRSAREPRLLAVENLRGNRKGSVIDDAIQIPADQVSAWAQHPAFLVSTVIDLPHTDVRTLANSMRALFSDSNTQQIIPVGSSSSLIITANGSMLASMVSMLRTVDDLARAEAAKRPPQPKPAAKEPNAKEPAKDASKEPTKD